MSHRWLTQNKISNTASCIDLADHSRQALQAADSPTRGAVCWLSAHFYKKTGAVWTWTGCCKFNNHETNATDAVPVPASFSFFPPSSVYRGRYERITISSGEFFNELQPVKHWRVWRNEPSEPCLITECSTRLAPYYSANQCARITLLYTAQLLLWRVSAARLTWRVWTEDQSRPHLLHQKRDETLNYI